MAWALGTGHPPVLAVGPILKFESFSRQTAFATLVDIQPEGSTIRNGLESLPSQNPPFRNLALTHIEAKVRVGVSQA